MDLPQPLVDAGWLVRRLGEPGLVVADVRWINGASPEEVRAAYEAGHVPGAVFLDVDRDLAARPGGRLGRHPLPDPERFAATMRRAGIGRATPVVATDDAGGSLAARLWWMLDAIGRPVTVLDGGLAAWPGPLETGPGPSAAASDFEAAPWPEDAIVDAETAAAVLRRGSAAVLDARAGERYRGEAEPIDPVAGHIPGAVSAPWAENLDPESGRFLAPEDLARRYASLGAGPGTIAYCGSGVTAAHDLLALRVAGVRGARLFEGSWSGWVSDPDRRVATGREPGEPA